MKRILALLLAVIITFTLAACANQPEEKETDPSTSQQINGTEPTNQTYPTQGNDNEKADLYEGVSKIGGIDIYWNFKEGRREADKSSSVVFHGTAVDLVALAYDDGEGFSGTPADALALINDGRMLRDIVMYSDADFHYYDTTYLIDVKTTENVKVNGYDMQKFTGSVMSTDERNCYVYGYAFVIEGTPCVLAGFVLSEDQEQNLIDAINIEVDTMVKTVRTEF